MTQSTTDSDGFPNVCDQGSSSDRSIAAYTLQALDLDKRSLITFTDHVYEGEMVDVFPTYEQAENEEGASVKMRVCRDEDDWWVEAV